jgi:head-tail adaptor
MYVGKFNRKVLLERLDNQADSFGAGKPVFVAVGEPVWASVAMKSGLASIHADSDAALVRGSIRIRYRLDVAHGWRASVVRRVDGAWVVDQVLHVEAVLPDLAGRKYTDLVVTGVGNGKR